MQAVAETGRARRAIGLGRHAHRPVGEARLEHALARQRGAAAPRARGREHVHLAVGRATRARGVVGERARVFGLPTGQLPPTRARGALISSTPRWLRTRASWRDSGRARRALRARVPAPAARRASHALDPDARPSARGRARRRRRVIGVVADVTARTAARGRASALEQKLVESQHLESLGLLAGGVAHDFNNLLVGILGNAELALQRPSADPACASASRRSAAPASARPSSCARCSPSRAASRARAQPVDLRELVDDTLDALRRSLPARARTRLVRADGARLRRRRRHAAAPGA